MELLAGETAVKIFLAQERLQQVSVLYQGFAQEAAMAKDDQRIMREKIMPVEQAHHFGRRVVDQALKQKQRRIRVGAFSEERGQSRGQSRRDTTAGTGQIQLGTLAILKGNVY